MGVDDAPCAGVFCVMKSPILPRPSIDVAQGFLAAAFRERWILIALVLVAGAIYGFMSLADEVGENETGSFDRTILLAFRSATDVADPIGPWWLEQTAVDFTSLGGYPVLTLITLLVIGYLLVIRQPGPAALVAVSIAGGAMLSSLLKGVFERTRPDVVPHLVDVHTASFPSGHAMLSAVCYLTLGALLMRVSPARGARIYVFSASLLMAFLIGLSRIYLGVHWPTDVLAGWLVGSAWALLTWTIAFVLQRRGELSKPEDIEAETARL